jgi:hypothetical protein
VSSNPINFIDPSGLTRTRSPKCDGPHDRGCVQGGTGNNNDDVNHKLTARGKKLWNWHVVRAADTDEWYYEVFGADGYSIYDSISMLMITEFQGHWTDEPVAEAVFQAASRYCGGPCTTIGYVNWFANFSKFNKDVDFIPSDPRPSDLKKTGISGFGANDEAAMINLSVQFEDHPSEWDGQCLDESSPCGWGNNSESIYPDLEFRQYLHTQKAGMFVYTPGGLNDNFFIPSSCVVHHVIDQYLFGFDYENYWCVGLK